MDGRIAHDDGQGFVVKAASLGMDDVVLVMDCWKP